MTPTRAPHRLGRIDAYWRAANDLSVGQNNLIRLSAMNRDDKNTDTSGGATS